MRRQTLWVSLSGAACLLFVGGCHRVNNPIPSLPPVHAPNHPLSPGEAALITESNYIVACSCTIYAPRHQRVQPGSDAYGAINDVRVLDSPSNFPDPASPRTTQPGPSWVRPGEAAMGAIGLMAAAKQLHAQGDDVSRYDGVLAQFFQTWLLAGRQPLNGDGGVADEVDYTPNGQLTGRGASNAGVAAQTVCAMWKYSEYLRDTGRSQSADQWLQSAWPLASGAGVFLRRCFNPQYGMEQPNAQQRDLWTGDSALACSAFWCLARWANAQRQLALAADYGQTASAITSGLERMKDPGAWHNFYRLRDSAHGFAPGYGDCVDQLCFAPYEDDAVDPGEADAGRLSDWWTASMTAAIHNPHDWRYFGTHWHDYFSNQPANVPLLAQNARLYPGPGLQLAKVEWKHAQKSPDPACRQRMQARYDWAASPQRSGLWLGAGHRQEAGISGGIADWRDANNPALRAPDSERFVDTSAYFLEVTLMRYWNIDTKYVPE